MVKHFCAKPLKAPICQFFVGKLTSKAEDLLHSEVGRVENGEADIS
jgi:hypothetical protein